MKIKASGGIKNLSDAEAMILAGASRLGTSAGVSIIQGHQTKESY
jgi:deoxyribose-phosphate aldolase